MTDFITLRAALAAGPTAGPWVACGPSFGDPLPRWLDCVVQPDDEDGGITIARADDGFAGCGTADMAYIAAADPATIAALLAALDDARADLAKHKAHIRLTNDIITNHCIAMQSALIEQSIGKGDEAALDWIGNTLAGPGLLPSMSDAAHLPDTPTKGPAQAWFDAKTEEHEAMRAKQDAAMKGAA